MTIIEKVRKGLECCSAMSGEKCRECPYGHECRDTDLPYGMPHLAAEALALLKEQELGHWIFLTDCSNSGVYCSECNAKVFDSYPFKKKFSYFCPHCGTRMEGEVERR